MNDPLPMSLVIILFTVEISFARSAPLAGFVIIAALLLLLLKRKWKGIALLLFLPLLPALATYWSVLVNGSGQSDALLLFVRTFAFAALGMSFTFGVDLEELLLTLETRGMPVNFVYGLLAVIHAFPKLLGEVNDLRVASRLRGKPLHFYSPMLYLKGIFLAFSWRDQYVAAMKSRGFDEEHPRHVAKRIPVSRSAAALAGGTFLAGNLLMILI